MGFPTPQQCIDAYAAAENARQADGLRQIILTEMSSFRPGRQQVSNFPENQHQYVDYCTVNLGATKPEVVKQVADELEADHWQTQLDDGGNRLVLGRIVRGCQDSNPDPREIEIKRPYTFS